MDLDYRRKQAQHHRHALEKLYKQWQQCLAESSCSDFGSGPLPVVFTRTHDPSGTLPLPALDTFLSPSNENQMHEETRVMSASSAASPPYVRTPFPAEAHPDPYSSFGLNALSSPLNHFALFEHCIQVNNGGYASLAEIQQLNHQTVDVVDATSMGSACQPTPSHSNGYNHGIEGRANDGTSKSAGTYGANAEMELYSRFPDSALPPMPFNPLAGTSFYPRSTVTSIDPLMVFGRSGWYGEDDSLAVSLVSRFLSDVLPTDFREDIPTEDQGYSATLQQIPVAASTSCDEVYTAVSASALPDPSTSPNTFSGTTEPTCRKRQRFESSSKSKRPGSNPNNSRSHMLGEEKAYRAAEMTGLTKEERRKVQNRLAQRALRERNKLEKSSAAVLIHHLEDVTASTSCDGVRTAVSASASPDPSISPNTLSEATESTCQRRQRFESISKPKRRGSKANNSLIYMSPEEKAYRAAETTGLAKGERRKVQHKLAQRAFRKRDKLKRSAAAVRPHHLEEIFRELKGHRSTRSELNPFR